jgi:hypothetical protein
VTIEPARKLAAAGTAGIGALAAVAAFLVVGGLPGLLYAAGIVVATLFGAGAIYAGRDRRDPALVAIHERATVAQPKRWGRKSRLIAVLQLELEATAGELEEHRHACANLAAQLSRESEAARKTEQRLEERIRELEVERDGLHELVTQERERFEQTLDELGGGIGRHESEIAEIERELEALIAR